MVRPRFHALPGERQDAILDAALEEFSAYGYAEASLNRIIASAGVSKGSMYYYFDGKEDLYGHVIRVHIERMVTRAGPFPVPTAPDPNAFWSIAEDYCRRLIRALDASPRLASLMRDWLSGTGAPAMEEARRDAEQITLPWFARALAAGQSVGAVRTDVPDALLLAVVTAMGRVMDLWLITGPSDPVAQEDAVHVLVDMLRRAIAP